MVSLSKLSLFELEDILVLPKNAIIKQYQKLFALDNIKLIFDREVIKYVDKSTYESNLIDLIFQISSKKNKIKEIKITWSYWVFKLGY